MKKHRYFLGIDLGTSSVKLVLIDESKQVRHVETVGYSVEQPECGWREIDPNVWFECLTSGLERLFEKYAPEDLEGIGVSGQMHTVVLLDQEGRSIRPAIMWDDTRTREMLPELRTRITSLDGCEYIEKCISTGSPAANLLWLKENEPENFAQLHKFLIAPDYIVYRLTGHIGTDYCEASTSCLLDLEKRCWSEPMRQMLGFDASVYPEIRGSACSAGVVLPEIAKRFGLCEDVKVIVGTGDNPATAISTGCIGDGIPCVSLGTSGVLIINTAHPTNTAKGKRILISLDGESFLYLIQGTLQSNGTAYEWWNRSILEIEDLKNVDQLLAQHSLPDPHLLFFPHMMGEKTLFADPELHGAMLGMTVHTSREDLIYSVMEGICYAFRELAENMQLDLSRCQRIRLTGGGSRCDTWAQVMANVLNVPIEQTEDSSSAGYGIALLAAYHCGLFSSIAEISEACIKVKRVFTPLPAAVAICNEKYQSYCRIYPAVKMVYP